MTRDQALFVLTKLKPQPQSQFGVSELALFGSAARNELHVGSDIDVLVKFNAPATSSRYFGVQFAIEDAIGMPVDLDRKSTRLNSSHHRLSRMPSSA